jgi:coenzyme F420-reducing hydrogenase alpha subunit
MDETTTRIIEVGALARVEGEGAMHVRVHRGEVAEVRLDIYEPPRFFEAFLRGRSYLEPPDITARICGICPVAYQVSACNALEDACGVSVPGEIRALRRLLYCGEWIQSHTLHVAMLHAPDFLGYPSVVEMAADHPEAVERSLRLKKIGNDLMELVGGRAVHPINVRLGGFYRAPSAAEMAAIRPQLVWAREAARETVAWVAGFDFPDLELDCELVALRHPDRYAIEDGRLVSDRGLDLAPSAFEALLEEQHVPYSNALHAVLKGRGVYHVGPLARYSLNFAQLSEVAREAALAAGLGERCRNPFRSIVVRAVEILYAVDEALRIVDGYRPPAEASVPVAPRAARGYGWSEAPRGMLYHRYTLDESGLIRDCTIVPPTSQNQKSIEEDLRRFVGAHLALPDPELQWRCEQAIRNYDPCISCATHFLTLTVDREA